MRIASISPIRALLTVALATLAMVTTARAQQTPQRPVIASWGYQLSNLDPAVLAASPYDAVVVDYSRDGSDRARLTADEVRAIKRKPDGRRRIVLAYLSIGEAETYRYYWKKGWENLWFIPNVWSAPAWRGPENRAWRGNYAVRYWDPAWQDIILGKGGYLDRIIDAGFDGVWLDKVDSALERVASGRDSAKGDMIAFIRKIREMARGANANFLIIPQNGEQLLADGGFRAIIDGLGVEDLLYGETKEGQANDPKSSAMRRGLMAMVVAERKPVLAVEYLDDPGRIEAARRDLATFGFVPHFADRKLDNLRIGDFKPTGTVAAASPLMAAVRRGIGWSTLALLVGAVIMVGVGLIRRKPGS